MSQDRNTEHQKTASADAALDALFSEAQLAPPEPLPDGLRSRLMADALAATTPAAAPPASAAIPSDGLPVGIQIVGRHRDDFGVLQIAHAFEQATGVGQKRPVIAV